MFRVSHLRWLLLLCAGCAQQPGMDSNVATPPRKLSVSPEPTAPEMALTEDLGENVLGVVGGVTLIAYPPRGLAQLSADERVLAYHLSAAALSGDALFSMQTSRFSLPAQKLVRAIYRRRANLSAALQSKISEYRRLLFLHHGIHDQRTGQRYAPPLSRQQFEQAVAGTGLTAPPELLDVLFDTTRLPALITKNPGPGKDPLSESAANHYEGVTGQDLLGFKDKFELNGRVIKERGKLVEQVYRTGDERTPPGLGAFELTRMTAHLQAASALAGPRQKRALEYLIRYFRTGENEQFRKHDIEWLAQVFPVDYILGFIEPHTDVRQRKGAFEGVVMVRDPERDPKLQALAKEAVYFEQKLPCLPEYKRSSFRAPAAAVVNLLAATGEAGSFTFSGKNLPNQPDLLQTHGSKNFIARSTVDARYELLIKKLIIEFAPAEQRAEMLRCSAELGYAAIGFHEITGHGSGKLSPKLKEAPEKALAPHYVTLEEARAQLVADYFIGDPKTVEIQLVPDAGCARVYPAYRGLRLLTNLMSVPKGDIAEQDHLRADLIETAVLLEKGALKLEQRAAKTHLIAPDAEHFRQVVGQLLAELQRIKSTADRAALVALVEKYGTRINASLRDEVLTRARLLALPEAVATVPPILTPKKDEKGRVVDVVAEQAPSFDAYIDRVELAYDTGE